MADARRKRKSRAERMPTEQDAINAMYDAYSRLKELGWNDGIYMPKDGTVVDVIEVASTGIHRCATAASGQTGFSTSWTTATCTRRDQYRRYFDPTNRKPRKSSQCTQKYPPLSTRSTLPFSAATLSTTSRT